MSSSRRPAPSQRTLQTLAWLLLALAAALCVLWFLAARGYWEDDAYIHLEFARSLSRGLGFSFNGTVVYGDTSPLWVWLLVGAHAFWPGAGGPADTAAWLHSGKALCAVAALFALSGVYAFAHSLVRRSLASGEAALFAALMVLTFVAQPYFGYWAFSGMEALAAAGLACWAAASLAAQPISPARLMLAAFAAGLAPLLRPEMAFLTLLLGLVLLQRWATMPDRSWPLLSGGLLAIAGPLAVWAAYAHRTFGSFLPNTDAAKRAAPGDSVLTRLAGVYAFGYPEVLLGLALLLLWVLWYLLRGRRRGAAPIAPAVHAGGWLMVAWTLLTCTFYIANHTFVQTRYLFVTAPVLAVALLAMAQLRWPRVYLTLLVATLAYGATLSWTATRPLVANKVRIDAIYAQLDARIRALPPTAPVAIYSIGEAAFLSQHPLVDIGGITRPGAIDTLWDTGDARRTQWIYSQGAQYEVIDHSPTPGATLLWSHAVPLTGWYFHPSLYQHTEGLQLWHLPPQP